jgi:glycosyltransferase involved in cell wall biosynthesis
MTPISAVIITFNEEKNIRRCLETLKGIADEIVVVDSFSSDKTEEICKEFDVKFVSHKFDGHIEQKNWAISQAKFPHILSLDADEAIDEILKKSILDVKKNWDFAGYSMNRLTNYCGKWIYHCGWYPDKKLRLWDSRLGAWGGDNPHDKFQLFDKTKKIQHLSGNILHYSYYSIEDHYMQVEYFTEILANTQFKKGKKASLITIVVSPFVKFIKNYFINFGFLDGKEGFTICRISAFATYTKYKKIRRLQKSIFNKNLD